MFSPVDKHTTEACLDRCHVLVQSYCARRRDGVLRHGIRECQPRQRQKLTPPNREKNYLAGAPSLKIPAILKKLCHTKPYCYEVINITDYSSFLNACNYGYREPYTHLTNTRTYHQKLMTSTLPVGFACGPREIPTSVGNSDGTYTIAVLSAGTMLAGPCCCDKPIALLFWRSSSTSLAYLLFARMFGPLR